MSKFFKTMLIGAGLLAAVIGALMALGVPRPEAAGDIDDRVHVIDGDTISIDGRLIQLYGIDAPELGQTCRRDGEVTACGETAAFVLHKHVELGGTVPQCRRIGDEAAANAMICSIDHTDLGSVMLSVGEAVTTPATLPFYEDAEAAARAAGLGIWGGSFELPWVWRASHADASDDVACVIKAVEVDGHGYYFVPTDRNYADVDVDGAAGGTRYCSDEAARAAGWIRPDQHAAGPS